MKLLLTLVILIQTSGLAAASDSHAGYYYPEPATKESYVTSMPKLPNTNKRTRIGFIIGLFKQQQKLAYEPKYSIFAKGADAEKLIIVSNASDTYNTLFRLRALMANLTSEARTSPLFQNLPKPEDVNFLDLVSALGFKRVTVSDGDKFAHRIDLL